MAGHIDSTKSVDEPNPYAPPTTTSQTGSRPRPDAGLRGPMLYLAWFAVFLLNLAIPLLLALSQTDERGRIGMLIAVTLLCATGCWVCANSPQAGTSLVVGGVIVGLTQLIPILQMFSGLTAMTVAAALGLTKREVHASITTEVGGVIVTLITGAILMSIAAGVGFVIERLMLYRTRRAAGAAAAARARKVEPT
jgi:hypothetical protein